MMIRQFITTTFLGWEPGTKSDYSQCHHQYGGNFITHPDVLDFLHSRYDCQQKYYIKRAANGELRGAFCNWHGYSLAGDTHVTEMLGMECYPFNKDEIILPLSPKLKSIIPVKTKLLSSINADSVSNSTFRFNSNRGICIAKGCGADGFSSATRNSRNRELKRFLNAGGEIKNQSEYSPEELASIYFDLFEKRWGYRQTNYLQFVDMMKNLRAFFHGHVLLINGNPCAFQLITKAESAKWISFDYVNGGYDKTHNSFCPGTIVTWLNVKSAYELCETLGKKMRYSFGRPTADYKTRWCRTEPVGRVLAF